MGTHEHSDIMAAPWEFRSQPLEGLFSAFYKWYIHTNMGIPEINNNNAPEEEHNNEEQTAALPIGIERIRAEWRSAGLADFEQPRQEEAAEPVVFPEIDGGAGIGDYLLSPDIVRSKLALSEDAIERLVRSGELDSILVQGDDGQARRLFSESSVRRFEVDSAIDPDAIHHAAKALADKTIAESIHELSSTIDELRSTQAKVLQQMKDMLLMELRNVKEQDRDLTSYVYELAEKVNEILPKKRR